MIDALLIALIGSLWVLLRPAKDWYVVEWRACTDDSLCSTAFPAPATFGFSKSSLIAHKLSIHITTGNSSVLRQEAGGQISIAQTAFENLDAARLHFESLKRLLPFRDDFPFQKLYLWRIVARSRAKALTLPPEQYSSKDGQVLSQHPEHLWFKPQSEASVLSPQTA